MSFKNKVVIVTGASSGIGAATAIKFTEEGANVVLIGRNETKLNNVQKKCENVGKSPLLLKTDLTDEEELKYIIDKTKEEYDKIDILINNAGILRCGNLRFGTIQDTFEEVMKTNLRSVVYLTTFAAPHLIASKGNIVNVSAVDGERVPWKEYHAISVAKSALNHFTRAAAIELGAHGVRVNAVSPSVVRTDIYENAGLDNIDNEIVFKTVMNTWTEPEEIADLILFVASDKARSITGSNFVSDNGYMLL